MNASLTDLVLAALISSGVVSLVLGFVLRLFFDRRLAAISEEIKSDFERKMVVYRSDREWQEQAVAGLLGPIYMQLDRSARAFARWQDRNEYIETQVMKEGNTAIRDLLLEKPHLLPPALLGHAGELIEHYDRWLEEYERVRGGQNPDPRARFVFVGPKGYPFPHAAERAFRATYLEYWSELYDPDGSRTGAAAGKAAEAARS